MATEVEQLYLQLELINIEEKNAQIANVEAQATEKMFAGGVCTTGRGWTTSVTWMNKCTLDNFERQRASSSYTDIKTGKSNCRKLRSERTNHSPYGPRRGDV